MFLYLLYKSIANPLIPLILKEKTVTVDGANHHGEWDMCLYNILLDLRGITGIVDLSVVLKGKDTNKVVTNNSGKNKD